MEQTKDAPSILDSLCDPCRQHLEIVQDLLRQANLPYALNPRMVRGLDYYCRTTFEWTSNQLGSQSAIGAGGRYDGLVEELGGPSIPGVGFAIGIERLTMLLRANRSFAPPGPAVYIVWVGENARNWAFPVVHRLRQKGLPVEIEGEIRSLKSQMRRADKLNASSVLIIGDNELDRGVALLRDMTSKQQRELGLNNVEEALLSAKANSW